jgi:hypothetical protein
MALSLIFQLKPQVAMCFISTNPEKATELTEELPAVHSKLNIKLNASICLSFMYTIFTMVQQPLEGQGLLTDEAS